MGFNQPMQSNPQEQVVQIPLDIEHKPTTWTNQTSDSSQRRNKWLAIIICIILAVTGQSITRLLENYYFFHRNRRLRFGGWTRSLVQVVGFPILLFPFLLLSCKKRNPPPITSDRASLKDLAIMYSILGTFMALQAFFSGSRQALPFGVFTIFYTTQLIFTPLLSASWNKTKVNRWMIISLIFATLTGCFTLHTFYAWSTKRYTRYGFLWALYAAGLFSILLCQIMIAFNDVISKRNESTTSRKPPSFADVLELVIFTSLVATVLLVAAVFISGEYRHLKRAMNGFAKGEMAYVKTMVGLAAAWQAYWVGIVGLVFSVSAVFSNVISVCTWPIVSLLVAFFYNTYEQYDVLKGIALATAALSVASYFYLIHKEESDLDAATTCP